MATILIAEARFYPHLNDMLLEGARTAIESAGHAYEVISVPGALESFSLSVQDAEALILNARIALGWIEAPAEEEADGGEYDAEEGEDVATAEQ